MFCRIALRICVQEALRGQTLAGGNVLDSQFSALEVDSTGALITDQDKPFVSVYTDGARISAGSGLELFGSATTDLVIEAGISGAMLAQDPETGERVGVNGFLDTDSDMELQLDLMMRQIADTLTRPNSLWAEMARDFMDVKSVERGRIGAKNGGVRVAGHELRISAELVKDPIIGQSIDGTTFARFLDALLATEEERHARIRGVMLAALAGDVPAYEPIQRELGLSDGQSEALGLRPLVVSEGGGVPELAGVTVELGNDL